MKIKIFVNSALLVISFLGFVFFWGTAYAATIFTDNFESYNLGTLNGQGGWVANTSRIRVQNTYVKEGEKAIDMFDYYYTGVDAEKSGDLIGDGQTTIYFMLSNTVYEIFTVFLKEGQDERIEVRIHQGVADYFDGSRYVTFNSQYIGARVWNALQIQWRSYDHKARYNINGGAWTDWLPTKSAWTSGLDTIHLRNKDSIVRVDAIQENLIGVEPKNPVLIVPGLLGTEMKKEDELLWADILRMLNPLNDDSFMDPLAFNSDLTARDSGVHKNDIIRNPYGVYDYTDGLIEEFIGQEYVENETLFTFPYDWRYGVSGRFEDGTSVSDLLGQKIEEILQQTGSSEVDVVAHSQGGLLVKKYAMEHPADNHIGKAVFVGVPNTGAPKAVKVLLQGDNFNVLGLNDSEVKKIAENMPASYDLLPSRQYYDSSFMSLVDIGYGVGSSSTEKDLNYNETKNYLTVDKNLNSQAFDNAEDLHTQDFDNFDLRTAGVDVFSVNGCKSATIAQMAEVKYKDAFGNYHIGYDVLKETSGDGTVPLGSSDSIPINDANIFYAIKPDHGKMPSQDGIRQQIVNLISGSTLNTGNNIITKAELDQDPNKCKLTGFWFSKHSPVLIEVKDQDGNRAGIAEDGSVQNTIPGADYQVLGEQAFVFIPTDEDQDYTINLRGEGSGTFTFRNSQITNGQTIKTEVFSNLPVTAELTGQINLAGGTTTLSLDNNGDGTTDQTVVPSAVVEGDEADDLLPPVSTATITGEQGQQNFYRSDASIEINATDDNSGILALEYNLDDSGFQKVAGDTATINVSGEGSHTLSFFATDRAGNNETEQTISFTIDKTPPEAIIEFDLGIKDLKFTGQDSSQVAVSDSDNVITLTDQAGNTTEITLKDKNRKKSMKAEVKSIKYNGAPTDISKNKMIYSWRYDKNQNLVFLSQHVKSKKDYNILAVYNGKRTTFLGRDAKGLIIKSFNGLKIIKVNTNKGDLSWSY